MLVILRLTKEAKTVLDLKSKPGPDADKGFRAILMEFDVWAFHSTTIYSSLLIIDDRLTTETVKFEQYPMIFRNYSSAARNTASG